MEPFLCWPDPVSAEIVRTLDIAGYAWQSTTDVNELNSGAWSGAIIDAGAEADAGFAFARLLRRPDISIGPILVIIGGAQLTELASRHELFDDFCVAPFHPAEFECRLGHLLSMAGHILDDAESIEYGPLLLNLETYQAKIDDKPLDLTYMEYELLKYLASNPGRVYTREVLLSHVWGYEYYGGARTVDVHIRRLRSKLGEEYAGLISTVRSVGYRFGESQWGH